jgi:hypothetical protein
MGKIRRPADSTIGRPRYRDVPLGHPGPPQLRKRGRPGSPGAFTRPERDLAVIATLLMVANAATFTPLTKTDSSRRRIVLDPGTVAVLRRHPTRQNELRLQAGELWSNDVGLVFTDRPTLLPRPVHPELPGRSSPPWVAGDRCAWVAALAGDDRARRWCPDEGGRRAARACVGGDHVGPLLACFRGAGPRRRGVAGDEDRRRIRHLSPALPAWLLGQ